MPIQQFFKTKTGKLSGLEVIIFIAIIFFIAYAPLYLLAPWIVLLLGLFLSVFIISFLQIDNREKNFLFNVFLIGYLLRILLAFILHISSLDWKYNPGFFIDDGWGYSENGWIIANGLQHGFDVARNAIKGVSVSGTLHVYDYINGFVYFIVGKSPLTMLFLNCVIGSLTLIFIYHIALLASNDTKISRVSTILCAFWPSLILWSTQNLKEATTIFLTVLIFWSFISLLRRFRFSYIALMVISFYLLALFRFSIAFIVAFSIFLHGLFLSLKSIKRKPFMIFIIMGMFSVAFILLAYNYGISIMNSLGFYNISIEGILEMMNYHRNVRAYANLALLPGYSISSIFSLLLYLPLGILVIFLAPFPWQVFSASQILAVPEMLIWYFILPFFIRGLFFVIKERSRYFLSIYAFTVIFLLFLGILEGNIGTMFRHRAIVMNFLLLFTAVGFIAKKNIKLNT